MKKETDMLEKFCPFIKDKCRNDCQFFTAHVISGGRKIEYYYYCSLDNTDKNLKVPTYID